MRYTYLNLVIASYAGPGVNRGLIRSRRDVIILYLARD